MQLRRYFAKGLSTAGRWEGEGGWFFKRERSGWRVQGDSFIAVADTLSIEERMEFLHQSGLDTARFKTRREAVAALELVLAAASPS